MNKIGRELRPLWVYEVWDENVWDDLREDIWEMFETTPEDTDKVIRAVKENTFALLPDWFQGRRISESTVEIYTSRV